MRHFSAQRNFFKLFSGGALVAGLLCPVAGQAAANYGVSLQSGSRAGHAGSTACDYNYGGTTGCSNVGEPDGGSGSVTPALGTNATAAAVSTAQTGTDYGQTMAESTAMTISGDLSSASLHFSAVNSNGTPLSGYGSSGNAQLADTLHFSVAGADAETVTPITVTFLIDGTITTMPGGVAGSTAAQGDFYGSLTFGGTQAEYNLNNGSATGFETIGSFNFGAAGSPNGIWTHNSDFTEASFTETYDLLGATSDLGFNLQANMDCDSGAVCDFANTAKFELSVPRGTRFTSDSGTFLSASGAVPEPETWFMMIGGLGLMGGMLRQRRNGAAVIAAT